jgi:acyl carrier protein
LAGPQDGIDRHEHATGGRGAEETNDRLDALLQIDGDSITRTDAEFAEAFGGGDDEVPQLAIRYGLILVDERVVVRVLACGRLDQLMDEDLHNETVRQGGWINRGQIRFGVERNMEGVMEVNDGVRAVLRDSLELGDRVEEFDADTPLFESLVELDSMAIVTVMLGLEEHFDIVIDDDEVGAETFETLGSLTRFIEEKLAA